MRGRKCLFGFLQRAKYIGLMNTNDTLDFIIQRFVSDIPRLLLIVNLKKILKKFNLRHVRSLCFLFLFNLFFSPSNFQIFRIYIPIISYLIFIISSSKYTRYDFINYKKDHLVEMPKSRTWRSPNNCKQKQASPRTHAFVFPFTYPVQ